MYNRFTMFLKRDRMRRWAMAVLAAIGFMQASLAFSDCQLDRASLAATMRSPASAACEHAGLVAKTWIKFTNRCFAHCTADLQTVGDTVALLRSPADSAVLTLVPMRLPSVVRRAFDAPQPGAPPPRILFSSFQV